jgi:hypothetical protein
MSHLSHFVAHRWNPFFFYGFVRDGEVERIPCETKCLVLKKFWIERIFSPQGPSVANKGIYFGGAKLGEIGRGIALLAVQGDERAMLDSSRKWVAIEMPRVSGKVLFSVASLTGFTWLLAQDQVNPVIVYLLQLYLAF